MMMSLADEVFVEWSEDVRGGVVKNKRCCAASATALSAEGTEQQVRRRRLARHT